jgi:hypothetical protein
MSFYTSGPAVGVGDGTLLISWPCHPANVAQGSFNLCPVMVWIEGGAPRVLVMDPTGKTFLYGATDLQFDPTWERP